MTTILRKATIDDAVALAEISLKTFEETWSDYYTHDLLSRYLAATYSLDKTKEELQDANITIYLSFTYSELTGFVKLSRRQALGEWIKDHCMEVCRIYVYKKFHDQKIGKLLMEKSIEVAKQEKFESLVLGVWEDNHRAVAFYKKFGFEKIGEHPFHVIERVDTDWVMRKKL